MRAQDVQQGKALGTGQHSSCGVYTKLRNVHRPRAILTSTDAQTVMKTFTNANFPVDAEGRTYHLGTKKGEVANRILSVGSTTRAQLLSSLLEPPAPGRQMLSRMSGRGFLTITGRFEGTPVSIVSTHMGTPNMDFVVRENRAVVDGQMAIVRLGTCGAIQPPAKLGDLLIASKGSIAIRRNPDAWAPGYSHLPHYTSAMPVPCDVELAALLVEEAAHAVGRERVQQGLNATADSFYSSQGRLGGDFSDHNEGLLQQLCAEHPDLISLEMETFHLYDLARCAAGNSIRTVGMCIALAERYSNRMMDHAALEAAELACGRAALAALARVTLDTSSPAARSTTCTVITSSAADGVEAVHGCANGSNGNGNGKLNGSNGHV